MIVGCITILLFLMSIFSKKNKVLYIVLFIWMWILMAFTTGIADEQEVYMSRYASPELWAGNFIQCNHFAIPKSRVYVLSIQGPNYFYSAITNFYNSLETFKVPEYSMLFVHDISISFKYCSDASCFGNGHICFCSSLSI